MKSIYGEVRVAVGQNDDDAVPEARVQVVVGNVVVKDEAVTAGAKPMLVYTETKKKEPVKA